MRSTEARSRGTPVVEHRGAKRRRNSRDVMSSKSRACHTKKMEVRSQFLRSSRASTTRNKLRGESSGRHHASCNLRACKREMEAQRRQRRKPPLASSQSRNRGAEPSWDALEAYHALSEQQVLDDLFFLSLGSWQEMSMCCFPLPHKPHLMPSTPTSNFVADLSFSVTSP